MKSIVIFLSIFLLVSGTHAQHEAFQISEFYPIEASHSYLEFSVKYMGYAKVKGKFEDFNGTIRFDENDVSKTSVSFMVNTNSIDTDHDWRDRDLKSDGWFDAENYPTASFTSKKVVKTDSGFDIIGDFTLKAITKEITINMNAPIGVLEDIRGDAQIIFTGNTSISRSEFGVEGKRWSAVKDGIAGVSDEVSIEISMLGKQIKEDNFRNWVRNESRPPGKVYKAIAENGVEAGIAVFEEMKADTSFKVNASALNLPGYMLLKEGKTKEALEVFKKNMEFFPEDPNVYDSFAEGLATYGKLEKARKYYEKALELNPDNYNAKEILRHLVVEN
ncbi:MAG: YceI family protein [Bacteroidota bacterium]